MAHFIATVPTALTPEDAFAYMADVTRFADWDPGVLRVVQVRGIGHGLGSAYDLTVQAGGTTVMRYEVRVFEPPRRIVWVARTTMLTSVDEVLVEAHGDGSAVTYDARLTLNGPLRLLDSLLAVAFRRIGDRAAEGLHRQLSAQASAG